MKSLFKKKKQNKTRIHNIYNYINFRIFGMFDFRKPMYFIRDPEMVKQLAVKDFDHFEDHRSFVDDDVDALFGNSLFMLHGEKWRDMRATLSPAFTGSKMRQMFELVTDCAHEMSAYFQNEAQSGKTINIEMKEIFSKYTNDVIASAAFGIQVNSLKDPTNEFFLTGKRFQKFTEPLAIIKLILLKAIPRIMKFLEIELMEAQVKKFFKSMVLDTMAYREKNNIFRPDMINILMQVQTGSLQQQQQQKSVEDKESDGFATVEESNVGKVIVRRQWSEDEIVAQCFLFFVAGFDTSSTLLAFAAYELALHPDIQEKLFEEVSMVNKQNAGQKLQYDVLQKMKYLDMVISEALRKWPPAAITDRVCVKDYEYDDGKRKFQIEKDIAFWIPIYAFHYEPKYFPEPEKFDPERFSDDNKSKIIPGTYIPFGIGPRNCIGKYHWSIFIRRRLLTV